MTSKYLRLLALAGAFLALGVHPARAQVTQVTDGTSSSTQCTSFTISAGGTVTLSPVGCLGLAQQPTVPGAPTIGVATAGNAQASVAFTAPASNGGSAILDYTATCGTASATGAGSPVVVTGLANGTAYTCTVVARNAIGSSAPSAASNSVTPALPSDTHLTNISTRMQVLTGENVLIGGLTVGGTTPKQVVIRARGPSLAAAGITNALANPTIQLFSGANAIASNDDWGTATNAAAIQASGFAPSDPAESAILTTLNPGAYTAVVTGVGTSIGVGIVEIFEVDTPASPLSNLSSRGQVGTGNDVTIGGFVIQGTSPQTVVIRARGPSLAAAGVSSPLANPTLQLFSGTVLMETNDDWGSAANAAAIQSSGYAPSNAQESVILVTLNPGAYTAIVSGVGGATGVAIIEIFALP